LQWRLTLGLTVVVSILWLAAVMAAGVIVRTETDKVFDSALQEVAQRVMPLAYIELLNRDRDNLSETAPQRIPSVDPHTETITYIVRDDTGRVLLQSHDADPQAFPMDLRPGFHDSPRLRLYTESAVQGTVLVTTAEPVGQRQGAVLKAMAMLAGPLIVLLPICFLGVWFLAAWSLRPLLAWQSEIEVRGRVNLAPVNATDLPAEVAPVAAAVDGLIARLRQALDAERSFTGNSAHELRTPIAAALAQTQRLIAELPEDATRARARSIETALRDLSRLSEKLLQLAKAEGGNLISDTPQNLAAILELVCSDLARASAVAKRLSVKIPTTGIVMSPMDPDAFAILARNLIENALKHGNEDFSVEVTLTPDGNLTVANRGPVVSEDDLSRLTRPFERGATQAKGSGLGLAIAHAIAVGAGGSLKLASPMTRQVDGFEARFSSPRASRSTTTSTDQSSDLLN
jgi:two-component system OmpR family sensor kinase